MYLKWIPVLWLVGIFSSQAQNSDERPLSDSAKVTKQADLSEVVIRGERMVTKHDRRLYYPTSEELERSPTVYSLLKRIPMPSVRIDEMKQSVTSTLGNVPKHHRLNGTLWLTAEISRFSIEGAVDSGWGFTEGENRSISRPTYNLSLQYRVPLRSSHALTLGISSSQLFQPHYLREKVKTLNRFVQQHTRFYSPVSGNLFLFTLNWKFSSGVTIEGVKQRIKAQKADSGLIE